ncbi:MAG TPA: tetratricopeptide repeat protein [Thermoanaerobaculia bacterium]|nr:tetratricopeptide repeat protein [Thermoanaerobaculia bacterium]
MGIRSRRAVALVTVLFLLVAGGLLALYLTTSRREVTTSSAAAYEAYRAGVENFRRFYRKEARADFGRALSLDPNFAMAMLRLANLSSSDQYKSLVERAARLRNRLNEREQLWVDYYSLGEKGTREERLKLIRTIHEKYPNDVDAAQWISGDEMAQGRPEEAIRIMMDLLARDPNNADVYNQCGYYYALRGEYEKGIENLKKYQFMAPDQANPYDSLGEIQAYTGHYDEAIANLNKALSLKPDFYESHYHLGVAYEGKGEPARAIEQYLQAAGDALTDGKRMDLYASTMRVAIHADDKAAVHDAARRVAQLPKQKETEHWMAFTDTAVDLVEGRLDAAEKRLGERRPKLLAEFEMNNRDRQRKPYFPVWNAMMALTKARLGKTDEAIALLEESINPPNAGDTAFEGRRAVYEAKAWLAALLAKKGDLDRAEKLLAENRAWNPSWAPTRPAELTVAQARREKVLSAAGETGDRKSAH